MPRKGRHQRTKIHTGRRAGRILATALHPVRHSTQGSCYELVPWKGTSNSMRICDFALLTWTWHHQQMTRSRNR